MRSLDFRFYSREKTEEPTFFLFLLGFREYHACVRARHCEAVICVEPLAVVYGAVQPRRVVSSDVPPGTIDLTIRSRIRPCQGVLAVEKLELDSRA